VRSTRFRLASAAAALPLVLLAGCSSSGGAKASSSSSASASASSSAAALNSPMSDVSVTTAKSKSKKGAATPTLTFKNKPFGVAKTEETVVTAGKGATVKQGEIVQVDFAVANGKDGKQLESTYANNPVKLELAADQVMPGLIKGLTGHKVGDRLVVAIPPADGFGPKGNPQLGIGAKDTMVWLIDIKQAQQALTHATGKKVAPKAGLPTVKVPSADKAAQITIPKGHKPPTKLVAQPLIVGQGDKVRAGQRIKVNYTGVVWRNGKKFDSSFDHGGKPVEFPIGVKQVISGWDKGLVGQTVGSRILLVVPPSEGYGKQGQPSAGIKGTDTLVFVVDILAALG
jgi:peptidylprolyl isomerase